MIASGPSGDDAATDEFYVGYLPMPPQLQRVIASGVLLLLAGVAACAAWFAGAQQSPGAGEWQDAGDYELSGMIIAGPYPMVRRPTSDGGGCETWLIVSEGKHGAAGRTAWVAGEPISLRGTVLHRGDRRMLELRSDERAFNRTLDFAINPACSVTPKSLGRQTLRGEIIDPKCYLGAMKPGGGKTHKACATLCIRGGIPPMFVTRDAALNETFYLLTDAAGGAMLEPIVPFIGEPVELSGDLEQWGDLLVIRIDAASVRRL